MTTTTQTQGDLSGVTAEVLISADSHVMESPDLWNERLPGEFRDAAPDFSDGGESLRGHPGGSNPNERVNEMEADGVSAEVLYPTLGLRLFGIEDRKLQEACCRIYNDWLLEYCEAAPDRLVGVGLIPTFDVDYAIGELERCRKAGLRGAEVWQTPYPEASFASDHYDRLWAAAQDLEVPVSLHISTGRDPGEGPPGQKQLAPFRRGVNLKLQGITDSLFDLIFSGTLERFPRLKLVVVEYEIGWLPFFLQQWDYYGFVRYRKSLAPPIPRLPSEYFSRQIFATFFNDPVGCRQLGSWGVDNCLWSNDFPHPNSTWPNSRSVVARDLGHLSPGDRAKLVCGNAARLYALPVPGQA